MQNDNVINLKFTIKGSNDLPQGLRTIFGAAITNVGFKAATNRQRRLKANLKRDFGPIVERELADMANKISRMGVALANSSNPPPGQLFIGGRVSAAMASQTGSMAISSMTGRWPDRNSSYMRWKLRKYKTRKWLRNTGRLQTQLKSVGTYKAAYGPLRVVFTPTTLRNRSDSFSSLGRSPGGQSTNIQIGRLEVEPLRRLRAEDLTPLGSQATYKAGLMSPLADSVEKKLTGNPRNGKYRPVIEPFLSYYLTRKIPNSVFLKLEDSYGLR